MRRIDLVVWQNVFVVVDTGHARPSDYEDLVAVSAALAQRHPQGIACLTIIPDNAGPPSEETRRAIRSTLAGLESKLRCLCWLVEGGGFQAATVRGVLLGLRLFQPKPPKHVTSSLEDGLGWIFRNLADGEACGDSITEAAAAVRQARESREFTRSWGE